MKNRPLKVRVDRTPTAAVGIRDPAQPRLQPVLISVGAVPALFVVAYRDERREVRAEDLCDQRVPGGGGVLVVQIAQMEDQISALRLDQLQHVARPLR